MVRIKIESYDELIYMEDLLESCKYTVTFNLTKAYTRYDRQMFNELMCANMILVSYSTLFKTYSIVQRLHHSTDVHISVNDSSVINKTLGLPVYESRKITK